MMDSSEEAAAESPVWPIFGDLMACLFGLFVLFFVWAIAFQVELAEDLKSERTSRAAENARLKELEQALAIPLADGRITLVNGRIGIRGSVLFALASAELQPEGAQLLGNLAPPLKAYLQRHDELIMVSGFTDDSPLVATTDGFKDNWELSAQRALTVTRVLTAAGLPPASIFAAGFGDSHPVAPNTSSENRARNRRVEISPIPRQERASP